MVYFATITLKDICLKCLSVGASGQMSTAITNLCKGYFWYGFDYFQMLRGPEMELFENCGVFLSYFLFFESFIYTMDIDHIHPPLLPSNTLLVPKPSPSQFHVLFLIAVNTSLSN